MIDRGEVLRKLALNLARFSGIAPLASPFFGGVGAVLMLHRVNREPPNALGANRHLSITPEFLDAVITQMKASGYAFVSMDEAVERLRPGGRPGLFATITSDDGYRDNLTDALPVFEKHQTSFTIYVAPALIEGTVDLWWDVLEEIVTARDRIELPTASGSRVFDCSTPAAKFRANCALHDYFASQIAEEEQCAVIRALARSVGVDFTRPRRATLMTWEEIKRLSDHPLGSIGAHSANHYNLKRLDDAAMRREMIEGARILEAKLGRRPRHFAYPFGYDAAVGPREVSAAKEIGFASAVTTRHGVLRAEHGGHLHALPRLSLNGRYQHVSHLRTMLSGLTTPLANRGKRLVTV